MCLKININDPISKLQEILEKTADAKGFLAYNGKLIQNAEETTFQKLFVKNNDKMVVTKSISSGGACIVWRRFGELRNSDQHDYYYLHTRYWDAVTFIAKRNVMFHGFGVLANPQGKDQTFIIMWDIDGEKSEEYTVETTDGDKDPEMKWHHINLKDLGVAPIKVSEGQKIDCCMKIKDDDMRRTWYGRDGYKNRYSTFSDQDYDFDTDYSRYNDNNTSADWGQIPFILYS